MGLGRTRLADTAPLRQEDRVLTDRLPTVSTALRLLPVAASMVLRPRQEASAGVHP